MLICQVILYVWLAVWLTGILSCKNNPQFVSRSPYYSLTDARSRKYSQTGRKTEPLSAPTPSWNTRKLSRKMNQMHWLEGLEGGGFAYIYIQKLESLYIQKLEREKENLAEKCRSIIRILIQPDSKILSNLMINSEQILGITD